jgi:DNA-binding SARP family transcriptional activator
MIRIRTLGPVRVTVGGQDAPRELLWRKNLALLVYLARSPRRRRTREHLIGLLWGGSTESAARHSLNEALRVLRRHGGVELIEADTRQVGLGAGGVRLDVEELDEALEAGEPGRAAEMVGGEFLEGFGIPDASSFEDWLSAERAHWRRRAVEALVALAEERVGAGDLEGARSACERALLLDPLSEAAVREAMRTLALGGDRAGSLALLEEFRERAHRELGLDPEPETARLADRIRRERTWHLPAELAAAEAPRRTPLVGREAELSRLVETWRAGAGGAHASALIVEGAGGIGKTRLVEEVVARARLEGAVVAAIRAVPADRDVPWSGLVGLAGGGLVDAPGLVVAPPGALAGMAGLAPVWRERFEEEIGESSPLPPGRSLSAALRVATEEQPVLLAVDDAQWLDPESTCALDAALRDHEELPLTVLFACTPYPPNEALDRIRARIGRELAGASVVLGPLGNENLGELARIAFPEYDEAALDRLVRRLAADSAGLPLLAVELLAAVRLGLEPEELEEGWPEARRTLEQTLPGELPDAIVAAIRVGFRGLTPDARELLAAASVLGERVDVTTLGRVTGLEGRRAREALDELEWSRWLAAEPRGYSFLASVVRDVVAGEMLPPGRRLSILEAAGRRADEGGGEHGGRGSEPRARADG